MGQQQCGVVLIADMVRAFLRGSAAGPTGMRPQHMNDALLPAYADEIDRFLQQLATGSRQATAPPRSEKIYAVPH